MPSFTRPMTDSGISDVSRRKTDMIGDDKLTTDFAKGGRVNFRGGGCTTKGINKKAYGKNS